jgi:NAD(P)-dependent dehydrogenase (short-subunit alcohol dehydrogenase family)
MIPSPEHDEEKVAIVTGASRGIGAGIAGHTVSSDMT